MAHASYYNPALHGTLPPVAGRTDLLKSLLEKFKNWRQLNETRRRLRDLPDYLLDDIGLTRFDIENYKLHN